jgi:hypothetical protein
MRSLDYCSGDTSAGLYDVGMNEGGVYTGACDQIRVDSCIDRVEFYYSTYAGIVGMGVGTEADEDVTKFTGKLGDKLSDYMDEFERRNDWEKDYCDDDNSVTDRDGDKCNKYNTASCSGTWDDSDF